MENWPVSPPANERRGGEKRPSVELRPAVGQNADSTADREEDGLETAVLCRAIVASTAIGNRAEHTNFISTTLQRNREVGREGEASATALLPTI